MRRRHLPLHLKTERGGRGGRGESADPESACGLAGLAVCHGRAVPTTRPPRGPRLAANCAKSANSQSPSVLSSLSLLETATVDRTFPSCCTLVVPSPMSDETEIIEVVDESIPAPRGLPSLRELAREREARSRTSVGASAGASAGAGAGAGTGAGAGAGVGASAWGRGDGVSFVPAHSVAGRRRPRSPLQDIIEIGDASSEDDVGGKRPRGSGGNVSAGGPRGGGGYGGDGGGGGASSAFGRGDGRGTGSRGRQPRLRGRGGGGGGGGGGRRGRRRGRSGHNNDEFAPWADDDEDEGSDDGDGGGGGGDAAEGRSWVARTFSSLSTLFGGWGGAGAARGHGGVGRGGGRGGGVAGASLTSAQLAALPPAQRLAALAALGRDFTPEDYEMLSALDETAERAPADDDMEAARFMSVIASIRCVRMPDVRRAAFAGPSKARDVRASVHAAPVIVVDDVKEWMSPAVVGVSSRTRTRSVADSQNSIEIISGGSVRGGGRCSSPVIVLGDDDDDEDFSSVAKGAAEGAGAGAGAGAGSGAGVNEACSVCLEDMPANSIVKILPCLHRFHPQCIDKWLEISKLKCPVCKICARCGKACASKCF